MSYIKKKSVKQEARTAKEFGGKTQLASGALWIAKGDVRTGGKRTSSFNKTDFLIENKFTDKHYYVLKKETWDKIYREAIEDNFRTPLMQIDILEDLELVVMDLNDYKEFNLEEHMQILSETITTNRKSFRIDYDKFNDLDRRAYEMALTPVIFLTLGGDKPVRLVIMKNSDFIYIWEQVDK